MCVVDTANGATKPKGKAKTLAYFFVRPAQTMEAPMFDPILCRRRISLCSFLAAVIGLAASAQAADTVPHSAPTNPLTYDARVVGMGGAGVATADGGAASLHNPALLQKTRQLTGSLTFTPYLVQLSAPFQFGRARSARAVQRKTGLLFGPFTQLGLVVRLHDRVVVGMNGFLTGAAGGEFRDVPFNAFSPRGETLIGDVNVGQFAGELQVPVAVRVTSWLDVAAAYRLTQAYTFAKLNDKGGAPFASASLRGTHLRGFQVGALSRVGGGVALAASYRSEVQLDLNGSNRVFKQSGDDITAERLPAGYRTPGQIRAGVQYVPTALPQVMATLEGHAEFYHRMDVRERDTFGGIVGGELTPLSWLNIRAGFGAATQPLSDRYATATAPPPSMGYSLSTGAGMALANWRLDVALAYATSGKNVRRNSIPGRYAAEGFIGSASATYTL